MEGSLCGVLILSNMRLRIERDLKFRRQWVMGISGRSCGH
jgi:hypothetical protein